MFGNHVHKHFSAYLHGELPAEDARRVADHLRGCKRCSAEFAEVEFGAQLASQLQREQAPESLWDELEAAMSKEEFSHRRGAKSAEAPQRKPVFGWSPLKIGLELTAVVALIGLGFVFLNRYFQPLPPDNRPSWEVTRLDGRPAIGKRKIDEKGQLPLGEWLTTDDASRAQISIGQIGEVKVEPNSRIQLVEAQEENHAGQQHEMPHVSGEVAVEPGVAKRRPASGDALLQPGVPGRDEFGRQAALGEVAENRQFAVPAGGVVGAHSPLGQRNSESSWRRKGFWTLLAVTSKLA